MKEVKFAKSSSTLYFSADEINPAVGLEKV